MGINKDTGFYQYCRGMFLLDRNDLNGAVFAFEASARYGPDLMQAKIALLDVYKAINADPAKIKDLKKDMIGLTVPVAYKPGRFPDSLLNGLQAARLADKAESALEGVPVYGEALYNTGDYAGAVNYLAACRQILPDSDYVDRWIALADIMNRNGESNNYDIALQAADRIIGRGRYGKEQAQEFKYYIAYTVNRRDVLQKFTWDLYSANSDDPVWTQRYIYSMIDFNLGSPWPIIGFLLIAVSIIDFSVSGAAVYQAVVLAAGSVLVYSSKVVPKLKKSTVRYPVFILAGVIALAAFVLSAEAGWDGLGRVDELIKAENYEKAYILLKETADKNPGDMKTAYYMGLLYEKQGKYDLMSEWFNKGLSENPPDYEIGMEYAGFHMEKEQYTEAKRLLERLLAYYPDRSAVYEALGDCSSLIPDRGSTYYYSEAAKYRDASPAVYAKLGLEYGKSGFTDEAERYFTRAVEEAKGDLLVEGEIYRYLSIYSDISDGMQR